jgi:hypothetical protein
VKAISIQQPWAWAIIHAGKDVENRSWNSYYRGLLAIHAPAKRKSNDVLPRGVVRPEEEECPLSAIIGVVELIDVVERMRSKWFGGPFGFVLAKPQPLARPISCKGGLGLWKIPPNVLRSIRRQLRLPNES